MKPVQIFSWTVGPAGADDGAAAVDDDAAELADGDPDAAEVVPELVAPPDGVSAFFEFELHPESATAPTTSAAIVVTSGFMRWTSMPETPVGAGSYGRRKATGDARAVLIYTTLEKACKERPNPLRDRDA